MNTHTYGKLDIEKKTEESKIARDITKTVLEFGVNQQQILRIAYLLSLELEDREIMLKVSECIKPFLDSLNEGEEKPKQSKILTT